LWPQAKLLAEVNAMLSSFTEQKAAAVGSAVSGMHSLLAQGRASTEISFNTLSQAASSASDAIKASTTPLYALYPSARTPLVGLLLQKSGF